MPPSFKYAPADLIQYFMFAIDSSAGDGAVIALPFDFRVRAQGAKTAAWRVDQDSIVGRAQGRAGKALLDRRTARVSKSVASASILPNSLDAAGRRYRSPRSRLDRRSIPRYGSFCRPGRRSRRESRLAGTGRQQVGYQLGSFALHLKKSVVKAR